MSQLLSHGVVVSATIGQLDTNTHERYVFSKVSVWTND